MIESLHTLSRNPLPAITALNLRGNRLRSLAGIERLLSLERLDLRDNNLTDPMEMARLTSLPEIREIWVSGNPFVNTHSGYRVVIMNIFRRTPGYAEDIIIDGRGPGFTERKQLVDRVAEPEGGPVVPSNAADHSILVVRPTGTGGVPNTPLPVLTDAEGEPVVKVVSRNGSERGTNRRKKIQRRRVVDLSMDNPFTTDGLGNSEPMAPPVVPTQQVYAPSQPPTLYDHQWKLDSGTQSGSSSIQSPSITSPGKPSQSSSPSPLQPPLVQSATGKDWSLDEELYRQQLDALRQEVGHNWISALRDHSRENPQIGLAAHLTGPSLGHSALPAASLARANSHAILSGGHTLGG